MTLSAAVEGAIVESDGKPFFPRESTMSALFVDVDGWRLTVKPVTEENREGGRNLLCLSIETDDGVLTDSIYLTAFKAAALADVIGKASTHIGLANALTGNPVVEDNERDTDGFTILDPRA